MLPHSWDCERIRPNGERLECMAPPAEKEEPMIETGIVLLLAVALTGVFVAVRIFKGRHARQNDDLRLHVIKKENRQNW